MRDAGCRRAVLEVSSHSLALERVAGLEFKVAVFTNLTRDHLDFHGDMDAYFAAKRTLFEKLLRPDGHAILNLDDDRAPELARVVRGRVWSYSLEDPKADLFAEELRLGLDRTRLRARTPVGTLELETRARRPLQRPERARGARRRPRARPADGRGAARHRDAAGRAGPHGEGRGRAGLHGARRLRPHRRRAQEPARDRARPGPAPRDHGVRLRRRPRPHQAPADGRRGRAALGRRDPHLRQPAQRAARGDPRRDPARHSRPRAPPTRS